MPEPAATSPTTTSCCSPEAQTTCCEPNDKADCCDSTAHATGTCGCSAGQTAEVTEVRDAVRARYAAAATATAHRVHASAASAIVRARKPAA